MIFNLNDIKEFLLEQCYLEWNGEVVDHSTGITRKATKNDFDYSRINSSTSLQFNFKGTDFVQDATITNFHFITYSYDSDVLGSGETQRVDKNLSQKWQKFLLKKYNEEYAKMLFDWCIENMAQIQDETSKRISDFTKEEKAKANKKINKYNEIALMAMANLSEKDLNEIN